MKLQTLERSLSVGEERLPDYVVGVTLTPRPLWEDVPVGLSGSEASQPRLEGDVLGQVGLDSGEGPMGKSLQGRHG